MGRESRDGKREKGWEERGVMGREIRDGKWEKGLEEREGMGRETMEQQVGRKKKKTGIMIEGGGTSGERQGDQGWRYK